MRRQYLYIFIVMLAGMYSCVEEDYTAPSEFSDLGWYTSFLREPSYVTSVGEFESFSDLSQGAVEHSWTIQSGNYFLKGPISKSDTILTEFIINEGDTLSGDKTIHVLFQEPGIQYVRLVNKFRDSVAFRGLDTVSAKWDGEYWVMDTSFMVDVYDKIKALGIMKYNSEVIDRGPDTLYVEAGTQVEFVDMSEQGRPNTRNWQIRNLSTKLYVANSPDSVAMIPFNKLGVYQAFLTSSRTGETIPPGSDRDTIPNPIKVIPSSQPFELTGDIVELEDQTIRMSFNGEFEPFSGGTELFTVMVNGQAFDVASVVPAASNPTKLDLKLTQEIYRPDVITVSFAGGELLSLDERSPGAFMDIPVKMHTANILNSVTYGFEDGGDGWEAMWDNGATVEFSTEQAATGNFSLKVSKTADQAAGKIHSINAPFSLEDGKTYLFKYKVYVVEGTTTPSVSLWLLPNWTQFWESIDNKTRGEWVEVTTEYEANADDLNRRFMLQLPQNGTIYFDDFWVMEKEVRP
ncbi:carbohydrate binding domain-containing protein [Echinicola pacifica]|nr:carbohydrate binding domain-containing protein [Echinicola pacifica]